MKTIQTLILCGILLSGSLLSCSKETQHDDYSTANPLYETYTGRLGAGTEEPAAFLQLELKDDGTLLTSAGSKALPGSGAWDMSGNRFTGYFRQSPQHVPVTLAGTYDPLQHKITGTWGYGEFTIGGGSFYVTKEKKKMAVAKKKNASTAGLLLSRFF